MDISAVRTEMETDTEVFVRYYHQKFWANKTGSSGPNSDPALTPLLRANLKQYLLENQITQVLDLGCGDANLFKAMDLKHLHYVGLDCVPELIQHNREAFADWPHYRFETANILKHPLPATELILCRDVLHYLPNELIWTLLRQISKTSFKSVLLTHNLKSAFSANSPTDIGIFRPVNLCQKPFYFPEPACVLDEDVENKTLALWHKETWNLCHIPPT